MYARVVTFTIGQGKREIAEKMAADIIPATKQQKGCQSAALFTDDSDGSGGLVVMWETQADADARSVVISPKLSQHLAGNTQGPPSIRLYEVLQS
ncbi:MAG: antibiotic biosynthesis monooxygenase [Chloroflexi bacterium]|nr:antibiotic biosynthesis monooxygenase [Chloroflexota bacterium]